MNTTNNKSIYEIFSVIPLIVTMFSSVYFYQHFPERVPTHWNLQGEIDGWSSRGVGAFAIPVLLFFVYIMFLVLPKIDPNKERYEQFLKPYKILQAIIIGLLAAIYMLASVSGLGYKVPIGTIVPILIGLMFIIIGNYLGKIKRNWFVGIRTPWTISSEEVWNKTHRLGGKVFVFSGILMILTAVVSFKLKIILFALSVSSLLLPIAYSYLIARNITKE